MVDLIELVDRTYGSLTGPQGHASFVQALATVFRSHVIARQLDGPGHEHAVLAHYDDQGRPMNEMATVASSHTYVNPWFESPMVSRLLSDGVAGDEGCVDPGALRRTEFYADILRPFDVFHSFGLVLEQGTTTSVISVSRSHRIGYYSSQELELAKKLLPHLRNVCAIQKALAETSVSDSVIGQRATWALDVKGGICGRNKLAYFAVNANAAALIEHNGGLVPSQGHDRASFSTAVSEVLAGARLHRRVPLRDKAGTPRFIAHIHHCQSPAFLNWLLTDPATALVTLQPLDYDVSELEPMLKELYGLTAAECRVAAKFLELESLRLVAAELYRSEETVRCQLKSIFCKTGVNSQGRLIKLLCTLTTR
ncbi:MAG: hypothetical protein ABL934_00530 [Lysobacteraceae bacterium]